MVCFPLNKVEEEEAGRPIPIPKEIITCCTVPLTANPGSSTEGEEKLATKISGETTEDATEPLSSGNTSIANFVFDMDDDVSAITLDFKIRVGDEQIDQSGAATGVDEHGNPTGILDKPSVQDDGKDSPEQQSVRRRMAELLRDSSENSVRDVVAHWDDNQETALKPEHIPLNQASTLLQASSSNFLLASGTTGIRVLSDYLPASTVNQPDNPPKSSKSSSNDKAQAVFYPNVYVPPTLQEEDVFIKLSGQILDVTLETSGRMNRSNNQESPSSPKRGCTNKNVLVEKIPLRQESVPISSGMDDCPSCTDATRESLMVLMELSAIDNDGLGNDDTTDNNIESYSDDDRPKALSLPIGNDLHVNSTATDDNYTDPPGNLSSVVTSEKRSNVLTEILSNLQQRISDAHSHEVNLLRLTEYIWEKGDIAKYDFVAANGWQILTSIMWVDMMTPLTTVVAVELALALLNSRPTAKSVLGDHDSGFSLDGDDLENFIDALLISMQAVIVDENLQQAGCRLLCCLASPYSGVKADGSSAGACLSVLNAMDAHVSSAMVQEWGLRALHNQCLYSSHAETNMRTLLSSQLNTTGATGGEILGRLIVRYNQIADHMQNGGILEWACKLCWCLTVRFSEMLYLRIDVLHELLHILEECRSMEDASAELQQAVLGLITNLSHSERYRDFLGTSDVILLILDTMHTNKQHADIQVEACNAITSLSALLSPTEREEVIDSGAVRTIVGAIFAFSNEKAVVQEAALRALVGLSVRSENAKEDICEPDTLSVLMRLCRLDNQSTLSQQEMLCNLIASIYASDSLQAQAIKCDTFGALTAAMATYSKVEKIQSACLTAYRNLSKKNLENLAQSSEVFLAVNAMITFRMNKGIQMNACCVVWNMGVGNKFGHQKIGQTKAIQCIITAIQTHLEVPEVVDVACGALWGLIQQSQSLLRQLLDCDGAIESVACTLVMHTQSLGILEKACGILATTCSSTQAKEALAAGGLTNTVDTMRNNHQSVHVLKYGSYILRIAINQNPGFVAEAMLAIPLLIHAILEFPHDDSFLKETCYFLWSISNLSSDAKSKIIACEGESTLLRLLDRNCGSESVQKAAVGAVQALACTPIS